MELVASKNVAAYELIYDRHCGKSYSLAFRMMGNSQQAEEIVQESFLSVWKRPLAFDPRRGSFRSWLLTMVHHRAIDVLRSRQVKSRKEYTGQDVSERVEVLPASELTQANVLEKEESREVHAALRSLPDSQGAVIELAYFGGFTHAEIAQMLDVPLGTVKGRMRLGLKKMSEEIVEVAPC